MVMSIWINRLYPKYKYLWQKVFLCILGTCPKFAGLDPETGESLFYKDILDEAGNVIGQETNQRCKSGNRLSDW